MLLVRGFARHQRDWEDLARLDAMWAIASTPERRGGGWDVDEFIASGRRKVGKLIQRLDELGLPRRRNRALDFGCGVGRLSIALADHFDEVVGVDIAPSMVERARENAAAAGAEGATFLVNEGDDLVCGSANGFDLVYTGLVLQHLRTPRLQQHYLERLSALVHPDGILVAQVTTALPLRMRLEPRRRIYGVLRAVGVPPSTLYKQLRLEPTRMTVLSRTRLERTLQQVGMRTLRCDERDRDGTKSTTVYTTPL